MKMSIVASAIGVAIGAIFGVLVGFTWWQIGIVVVLSVLFARLIMDERNL